MDVILLESIRNLGELGEQVSVKAGFGRNYLLPQGKAVPANAENVAKVEARRAELEKIAKEALAAAQQRAEKLTDLTISMVARAGDEGKLYGSIGVKEIADEITAKSIEVAKSEITLPEGPIRVTGEYDAVVHLHTDVEVTVKVVVTEEE
ncbi:MAG: 50S ribosomal protein L9 [Legionellales bacterium]|nr:50S ribosomal protein L9 [Legionellales bacterium]|tara:strand:- start:46451 stop:46900 length:450 start_codon:yes stop_codon:yes gene_type:complete